MNIFKRIPVYIKIYENSIVIHRLDNRKSLNGTSNFSDSRIIVANFEAFELLLNKLLSELVPETKGYFASSLQIIVQQLERNNPKISEVEKRTIIESCERVNGIFVIYSEEIEELPLDKAKQKLFDLIN